MVGRSSGYVSDHACEARGGYRRQWWLLLGTTALRGKVTTAAGEAKPVWSPGGLSEALSSCKGRTEKGQACPGPNGLSS